MDNPLLALAPGERYVYYKGQLACDCASVNKDKKFIAQQAREQAKEAAKLGIVYLCQRRSKEFPRKFEYIATGRRLS